MSHTELGMGAVVAVLWAAARINHIITNRRRTADQNPQEAIHDG